MLCWLITICTIAWLWIVIHLNVVNEGGSESDRLGWHSRTRTRTRDGGRKWVWTTRLAFAIRERERGTGAEVSLNDSFSFAIRERERGAEGGSESERLTESFTGNTTERTNERTNDSFWRTERRELIRGNESWNPSLRPTRKLASPWVPSTKSQWVFPIGFCIIAENKLCGKQKFDTYTFC